MVEGLGDGVPGAEADRGRGTDKTDEGWKTGTECGEEGYCGTEMTEGEEVLSVKGERNSARGEEEVDIPVIEQVKTSSSLPARSQSSRVSFSEVALMNLSRRV